MGLHGTAGREELFVGVPALRLRMGGVGVVSFVRPSWARGARPEGAVSRVAPAAEARTDAAGPASSVPGAHVWTGGGGQLY